MSESLRRVCLRMWGGVFPGVGVLFSNLYLRWAWMGCWEVESLECVVEMLR